MEKASHMSERRAIFTNQRVNYRGFNMTDQAKKLSVLDSSICDLVDIDRMKFEFISGRGTNDTIFTACKV